MHSEKHHKYYLSRNSVKTTNCRKTIQVKLVLLAITGKSVYCLFTQPIWKELATIKILLK
jgi:ACT domain-containing protein